MLVVYTSPFHSCYFRLQIRLHIVTTSYSVSFGLVVSRCTKRRNVLASVLEMELSHNCCAALCWAQTAQSPGLAMAPLLCLMLGLREGRQGASGQPMCLASCGTLMDDCRRDRPSS
eukprot:GHUV01044492.1.p1 GENE.GHUV01044492.1~~GHUV01044492.1.p1  ORF type:complete len:116 (-),score=2.56 GHUV01044492.1:266-613(-)